MRGSWTRTELQYIDPQLLWPSALCLSRSPDAQPEARDPFFWFSLLHLFHQLVWSSNSIGGPEGSFCWVVAFPTTSFSPTRLTPTHWLPISTELYNSLIAPLNRPLNLWDGMFDRHQEEITVMQFTGHSLPVHQSMSVPWDFFTLSHFVSQARLRDFLS